MKQHLEDYIEVIKQLPLKEKYTKDELLIPELLIEKQGDLEIYYAPHNEYLNPNAKVFIIGITPGFEQMSTAIAEARRCIEEGLPLDEIKYRCKVAGRFSGSLRRNLLVLLNELNLNTYLGINDAKQLFNEHDDLLHTISLIPYPVFVKGKNYTGHSPKLLKTPILLNYITEQFIDELSKLDDVLIIPLGKGVEEALLYLASKNLIKEEQVLKGFPHPSGANAHRFKQFEEHKQSMFKQIDKWFNKDSKSLNPKQFNCSNQSKSLIREMRPDDIEMVMNIWLKSTIKAHPFISSEYWYNNYHVVKEVYLPKAKTAIFEEDGVIKGFISIIDNSFIGALFVHPTYQGHGIGRSLIHHAINQYKHLSLAVYKDTVDSVQFYQKQGFKIIDEQINEDSGELEYIMQK